MDKMRIYNAGRAVPDGAVKKITGGAYGKAGLSDINPQWRIEKMTELFGPCGIGWTWQPEEIRMENGLCLAHVTVRYRIDDGADYGQFSEPVHGYGGTAMGKMNDDSDVLKSTFTDAVSNALRYLGIGADVWYKPGRAAASNQFDTKYSAPPETKPAPQPANQPATPQQLAQINSLLTPERIEKMLAVYKIPDTAALTQAQADLIIKKTQRKLENEAMRQDDIARGIEAAAKNGG